MPKESLHQACQVTYGLISTQRQARCLHDLHSTCSNGLPSGENGCSPVWPSVWLQTGWPWQMPQSCLAPARLPPAPPLPPFMMPVLTPMTAMAAPWAAAGSSLAAGCSDLKGVLGAMAGGVAGVATSSCTGASACRHSEAVSQGYLASKGKGCWGVQLVQM